MIAGRFTVGLGVGLASCIIPLYIGELSPTKIRGQLVTVNAVTVTFGQVVAYGELEARLSNWLVKSDQADISHRNGFLACTGRVEMDGRRWSITFYRATTRIGSAPRIA